MPGLGTIVNTIAVVAGGVLGICLKKGLKESLQKILICACGISTIFIGAGGVMQYMLYIKDDGSLGTTGALLLILSLVLGGLAGEALDIEGWLERLGERLRGVVKLKGEGRFVDGFVSTSLIICVGAMAIVGSIQDGLAGDSTMLLTKSLIDFVTVMVMASACGVGSVFSALPLFLYQGAITLLAMLAGNIISDALVSTLSFVGSALIFCVGVNLCFGNRIKTGNLLPAMLVPVFADILQKLF